MLVEMQGPSQLVSDFTNSPTAPSDERQKLSLSHFAFAIALLSGWGPTSSTHLSFHLVFSLVPRNFSLGDEPFAEPSAGMSEGYGQLLLLNAVRSQRGLLIWVFPSVSLMHIRGSFYQCVTLSVWERRNNFLTQSAEVTNANRWPMLMHIRGSFYQCEV